MKNSNSDYKDFNNKYKVKAHQILFKIIFLHLHQKGKQMLIQLIHDQH